MAQKPQQPEFFNTEYTTQMTEAMKAFAAFQWKTSQTIMDQAMRFTQSWMDLGHECYKSSMNAGEGARKEFCSMTEKYFNPSI
ncbi:MAG: hypothetical protein ACK4VO_04920 [Pseudobdellovibrio sp.]